LIEVLKDNDPVSRQSAAIALGTFRAEAMEAVQPLLEAIHLEKVEGPKNAYVAAIWVIDPETAKKEKLPPPLKGIMKPRTSS
jgi:hypothetical protein